MAHAPTAERWRRCARALLLAALTGSAALCWAQSFPSRYVRLIVPFPAGSTPDLVARCVSRQLGARLGQQIVLEHRAGGDGDAGTRFAAEAPADGYTLLWGNTRSIAVAPYLHRNGFNPAERLAPVTMVARIPQLLVAHPALRARSLEELIALARANPRGLRYTSPGRASMSQLTMESFAAATGVSLAHVPHGGAMPAVEQVIHARVDLMWTEWAAVERYIRSGSLLALAASGSRRAAGAPAVPTAAESGVAGFDADIWFGLFAPLATSPRVLQRVHAASVAAAHAPPASLRLRHCLGKAGAEAHAMYPPQFAAFVRTEYARWGRQLASQGSAPLREH